MGGRKNNFMERGWNKQINKHAHTHTNTHKRTNTTLKKNSGVTSREKMEQCSLRNVNDHLCNSHRCVKVFRGKWRVGSLMAK